MKYISFDGDCRVSRLGFGTGGFDGVGYRNNTLFSENPRVAAGVIRRAFDLGITVFDTAPIYGTEDFLRALPRQQVFISTKSLRALGARNGWATVVTRNRERLEESLSRFGHIDFYFFHAVTLGVFDKAGDLFEAALKWQKEGKIRYLGISEDHSDKDHKMLHRALESDIFDVVMGVPNDTFPYKTVKELGINTFAMRAALGDPNGYVAALDKMDVVLIGTSSVKHLEEDVKLCG